MIWLIPIVGTAWFLKDLNDSCNMSDEAIRKLDKAYRRQGDANMLIQEKSRELEDSMKRLVARKRGIAATSVVRFRKMLEKVKKVEGHIDLSDNYRDLLLVTETNLSAIKVVTTSNMTEITELELISAFIFGGLGGTFKKDAEKELENAKRHMRNANIVLKEAENIARAMDIKIMTWEANRKLLTNLNQLFVSAIKASEDIINLKGKKGYTKKEEETLCTCLNVATVMIELIKAPILSREENKDSDFELALEAARKKGSPFLRLEEGVKLLRKGKRKRKKA